MTLYEYKNENGKWSRSKVKDLTPGTPEYKFYEKNNFIEEKWFKEQEFLNKYPEDSIIYKSALKKIKILEDSYEYLKDMENRPLYNIEDTIEDMKRMNIILISFIEEILKHYDGTNENIKKAISEILQDTKSSIDIDSDYSKEEIKELIDKMIA